MKTIRRFVFGQNSEQRNISVAEKSNFDTERKNGKKIKEINSSAKVSYNLKLKFSTNTRVLVRR